MIFKHKEIDSNKGEIMANYQYYYKYPKGFLKIVSDDKKLLEISFETITGNNSADLPAIIKDTALQLDEYFDGKRSEFDVAYNLDGTEFQKQVWRALAKIPFGSTKTYGEIAAEINNKAASRAVGGACNRNPLPIIIPCHRVVGGDGSLVGFGGTIEVKEFLLELENSN